MKIGTIGYNYSHDKSFVMDCPNGPGSWLFLIVKTPAVFEIGGEKHSVQADSYVILSPRTSCRYYASGDAYTDDWIFCDIDETDLAVFMRLGIKTDCPVHLGCADELSRIVHILAYEHYSPDPLHEEIEEKYVEILLLKLGRLIQSGSSVSSDALLERNYRFTQLRTEIFTRPEAVPDIETMAAEVGMSRSGFQHTYKKMFGVNVMSDVIGGRIDLAKRLLSASNLTVKEIAYRCGYSNEYNFMRHFKERCGKTPTEYRKSF